MNVNRISTKVNKIKHGAGRKMLDKTKCSNEMKEMTAKEGGEIGDSTGSTKVRRKTPPLIETHP